MPKISLTIHTASFDYFLQKQGIDSYFDSVVSCLLQQTFKDFEFIYIDAFYENNKDKFATLIVDLPFQVKHVPIHHYHKYWFNLGHTYIAAAKNTGILYADGELVVTCDDAEFFSSDFLEKYWQYYESGYLMHAFHKRLKNIKTVNGTLVWPIDGEIYINDSRRTVQDVLHHKTGNWLYAGTSFDLEAGLELNGFNEKMDGCKSLEDADFGLRLAMIGRKFVLDQNGFVYILDHDNEVISERAEGLRDFIAVENYGVLRCAVELQLTKANVSKIDKKQIEIIRRETLKYRGFDPFDVDHKETTNKWLQTPNFDLRHQRTELRRSSDWKW